MIAAAGAPLAELERLVESACGLTLSPGIRRTLGDAFERAARELQLEPPAYLGRLRAGDAQSLTTLVEAAVVGETYFFRHPEQLAAFQELVIAPAPRDRPLRIWSAGCATGEEPYTLAMALLDAGRAGAGDRILATDVSARVLAVAHAGRYGSWSLRRIDPAVRARHFDPVDGDEVLVRADVRALVDLRRHNLVRDPRPGDGFDAVVCRNVLIYFTADTATAVVRGLVETLRPGGVLVLGPVELPLADGLPLERVEARGALVFRRAVAGAPARPARALRPVRPARPRLRALRPDQAAAAAPAAPPPQAGAGELRSRAEEQPAAAEGFEAACAAARRGDLGAAERLARSAATRDLLPEAWLLVSMAADARGDLEGAVDAARRALYLEPGLALAHATLVPLYRRLGREEDAARARRNALDAIAGLDDATPLRGVETVTAGALRSALEPGPAPAAGRELA